MKEHATLLAAVLGLLGTIMGVWVGTETSAHQGRESAQRQAELDNSENARQKRSEVYPRFMSAARTAYLNCVALSAADADIPRAQLSKYFKLIGLPAQPPSEAELAGLYRKVGDTYDQVRVYGSETALKSAFALADEIASCGFTNWKTDREESIEMLFGKFSMVMCRELSPKPRASCLKP